MLKLVFPAKSKAKREGWFLRAKDSTSTAFLFAYFQQRSLKKKLFQHFSREVSPRIDWKAVCGVFFSHTGGVQTSAIRVAFPFMLERRSFFRFLFRIASVSLVFFLPSFVGEKIYDISRVLQKRCVSVGAIARAMR